MKTFKKNKLGVIVLALLLFGVLCFSISGKALADTSYIPRSENQIKNVSLKFGSDRSTIIATFPAEGSVRSGFIILTDNDPTDAIFNYKPPSGYCSAGNNGGITFGKNGAGTIDAAPGSFGAPIKAYVDLDYLPAASASNGACVDTKNGPASSGNYLIAVTNASVLNQELQWQADGSLTPLAPLQPGVSGITSYKSYSFAPTALDNILRFDGDQGRSSCPDVAVVASNNQSADIYYLVNSVGKNQVDAFTITALKGIVTSADSCGVLAVNYSANNPTATQIRSAATYGINGSRPTPPSQGGAGATTPVAGARGSVPDTCEGASNGFSFAWLACPLVGAGQEISDSLINAFEGELSFNVNQSLGNKKSQASVQQTWSLVRNLATAFLVVLMLVMVISQAVGGGPFDAYTVRKMLPRLVAVAIAIQLSWPLVSWVIDTFDDLGRGIADIMYFSFGGADSLSLGQILANAHIGTSTTETISWVGIITGIGLGIAALPATLLFLLAALAAVLTAVITLVLRKIIIIVLLIFAPIALLAYVLPGTQKYWKLWLDNFIKILAMFPLVVILVSSGRIFAYIVGTQDYSAFLNFIFIMIGFFGPLFLLPKTYKWGGQAMSLAANAVSGVTNRFAGKESALGKGVQGFGERTQGQWAKGYDPNASFLRRGARRLGSGHLLPTPRSRRLAIAAGDKWANERNEEADALVNRTQEKAMNGYDYWEMKDGKYVKYRKARSLTDPTKWRDINGNDTGDIDEAAYEGASGGLVGSKRQAAFDEVTKEQAHTEMTGVQAGKQALVDISGYQGSVANERAAQAAQKRLIDTSSEIEMQNSVIQGGPNAGRRFAETQSYKKNVASSPPHYSTVNRTRFDFAPDLMESAEDKLKIKYEDADEGERKDLDKERLKIAIGRMTPENMQSTHYGFYQDVAGTGDAELSQLLAEKIHDFAQNGGTIGSSAAGSLRGGRQKYVDQALAVAGTGSTLAGLTTPHAPPP